MLSVQTLAVFTICLLATSLTFWLPISNVLFSRKLKRLQCCIPPQYPQKIPFLGSDLFSILNKSREDGALLARLQRLFRTYGKTFQATMWGQTIVYTMDAANLQAIHTTQFKSFGVEPIRKTVNQGWMGDGIFVSDGHKWKSSRSLLKPAFAKGQFGDLVRFETHVGRLLALVPRDGSTVDLQPLLQRLFLDVSTQFLFGESAQSLLPSSARLDVDKFNKSFDRALLGMTKRQALGKGLVFSGRDIEWEAAYKDIQAILDGYIIRALEQSSITDKKTEDCDPLPEYSEQRPFSMLNELVKDTQDQRFIRDQLLNIFIPARDSSAIGVSDLFFQLARNPRVWNKLRSEALEINQPITFELLKSMKYLQCVLSESVSNLWFDFFMLTLQGIRLLAPADVSYRTCLSDCVLPSGGGSTGKEPILISRGTRVEMRIGVMHRDPDYWGSDAEEFRPERWLAGLQPKWKYVPFLGGARVCPAQQMVLTQYAFILLRFLQEFELIENRDPEIAFIEEIKFGKKSRNGVKVAFKAAKKVFI